jgi:hypothetical protein
MDKAHRTAFNDMLEQAKTHSLATFEAKYQKGLERIRKTEMITYRKSLSSTTDEYRKRLDASFNKHRIAMNQKSNDMETLANDLVENAPFEANKEISFVVKDKISEVIESITNIEEQSIAEWTSKNSCQITVTSNQTGGRLRHDLTSTRGNLSGQTHPETANDNQGTRGHHRATVTRTHHIP